MERRNKATVWVDPTNEDEQGATISQLRLGLQSMYHSERVVELIVRFSTLNDGTRTPLRILSRIEHGPAADFGSADVDAILSDEFWDGLIPVSDPTDDEDFCIKCGVRTSLIATNPVVRQCTNSNCTHGITHIQGG